VDALLVHHFWWHEQVIKEAKFVKLMS
jgi:hypothetical protein